jgi:hypothetical protein
VPANFPTCNYLHDSGYRCGSAALKGRDYCAYHLRYRGRLMRMAQARARGQRFTLQLPPLNSYCSIQSALTQVAEALAADMIDPRRAQVIVSALRLASRNLKYSHPVIWHENPYANKNSIAYDEFEAEFGLPANLDLDMPPEVAFPEPRPYAGLATRPEPDTSPGLPPKKRPATASAAAPNASKSSLSHTG